MDKQLDLLEETLSHFSEGAKSVWAYAPEQTFIITPIIDTDEYWIAKEEPGFPKTRVTSLHEYFSEVFGIEARY